MICDDAKLKAQALVDNELAETEIPEVMEHVQSCYACREEYIQLLRLQRKMKGLRYPEPPQEWFERLNKRVGRKISSSIGQILFLSSYLALIAYALYSLFAGNEADLFIKIVIGGILAGIVIVLGVTIGDRAKEYKDDKYKGVMK